MNILTTYNSALQVAAAFLIFVVGYLVAFIRYCDLPINCGRTPSGLYPRSNFAFEIWLGRSGAATHACAALSGTQHSLDGHIV